jgi:hypothetical protein
VILAVVPTRRCHRCFLQPSTSRRTRAKTRRSARSNFFTNWTPPFEFKAHYTRADGKGGIAIFDANEPTVILEGIAPFTTFFDFDVTPVTEVENAVPVFQRVNDWRDSVR